MRYANAIDFRRALTDRLSDQARREGAGVSQLQRRVAFERFLARLFHSGNERWVLKGGYALELRLGGKARATVDIDLSVPPPPFEDLLDLLQAAAEHDLKDFFSFRIMQTARALQGPPLGGHRFMVDAILAGKTFSKFAIDVGQGDEPIYPIEWLNGQVNLEFAGLPPLRFPSYPLADHFAEKLHAYTKPRENPSRVKDLIDMALILELGLQANAGLADAIRATFDRYDTHPLPDAFPTPPESWLEPFESSAKELELQPSSAMEWHQRITVFLEQTFAA